MGTRLYPIFGGMRMIQKFDTRWMGMRMKMNFFYRNTYEISKLVLTPSRCHSYCEQDFFS